MKAAFPVGPSRPCIEWTPPTPPLPAPSHLLSLGEQEFLVRRQKKRFSGRRWGGWKSFFWKEQNALGWQGRFCIETTAPSAVTFLQCPHPHAVLSHSLWTLLHTWLGGRTVTNPEQDSKTLEGLLQKVRLGRASCLSSGPRHVYHCVCHLQPQSLWHPLSKGGCLL